ncbi:phosphomannomutase [Paracoccaceae bacterium]|nr:phosphomannomutase [Paracoccaceae bacterium]
MTKITCFKTYDIRGEINVNINEDIAYRIGRAVAQHFAAKSIVIGFDARQTSKPFAAATAKGIQDAGTNVIDIGLAGTEEMYWAVTGFSSCAGIEITASHNPINYNGMKIVKSGSAPLDDRTDFQEIKKLAETRTWAENRSKGIILNRSKEARADYVDQILSFTNVKLFKPLKIVVNSGNGAAGPTFDTIAKRLSEKKAPLEFFRMHHTPDHTFPNGIPNPLLPENQPATVNKIKEVGADFGIAFDGDFDRCFFFDENGRFVPGEYMVGLLASVFLEKERGAKIVHDPRVIWNTKDVIFSKGGIAVQSKTGHSFIKKAMRENKAIYGGELSAHHYFRDFAYCDSGMIPWILIAELISVSGLSLGEWVKDRLTAFPSSSETNFPVENAKLALEKVLMIFRDDAISIDDTDGLSLEFEDWRFNLRRSNTEQLLRLNIETKGNIKKLRDRLDFISNLLGEN